MKRPAVALIAFLVLANVSSARRPVSTFNIQHSTPPQHSTLNTQHSTPVPPFSPERVKSEIRDILSSREFRAATRPSWLLELQERVINAVFEVIDWLARLFSHIELRPNRLDSVLEWTIAILAYLLAAVGIFGILYIFVQAGRRLLIAPGGTGRAPRAAGPAEAGMRTAEEALRLAAEHAQQGEFRDAFRAAYLAILLWLDTRQVVEYAPSRTNWEYVRAAAGSSPSSVHEPFRTLTGTFDRKVYGGERCGPADYETVLSVYNTIASIGGGVGE